MPSEGYLPTAVLYSKYNEKELDTKKGLNWYDYGARNYDAAIGRFMTVDPMAEKYYETTPYAYCENRPSFLIDRTGKYGETPWDVFSFLTGVKSFAENIKQGNVGSAIIDGVGIVLDAAAIALPAVPGGAGASIKAVRAAEKIVGVTKTVEKVVHTSRSARREVMRKEGIPTSQQPKSRSKNASGREYTYEIPKRYGEKEIKSVQQQTMDRSHKEEPHWEAGNVKTDKGKIQMNNYKRPKLENKKTKEYYYGD